MQSDEFINSFLEFEKKYNMFNAKINNVHFWHYIRFGVYIELTKIMGFRDGVVRSTNQKKNREKSLEFIWKKEIANNQFFAHQRDVLLVSHGRKYKDEGKYYKCPYTHLLDEYLSNSHYILDRLTPDGNFELQKSRNVLYSDIIEFNKIKRLSFPKITVARSEIGAKIVEPIEKYFGLHIGSEIKAKWARSINDYINSRKNYIIYYNWILKRIKPKIIVIAYAYGRDAMLLCEVAHARHIPVVELQHGMMGGEHIAYNFPGKMRLKTFPDYIFTFGSFEKKATRFPIPKSHIIPTGYPELENTCGFYKKKEREEKHKKVILFISALSAEIAKYANTLAEKLDPNEYQVVVQLHPFEYSCWRSTIGKYLKHPKIKVVGSYDHPVYESLAQADWVVGNYSTVLSEAQMFDVKVAVLKFEMYRNVKFLYENGYAVLVDSPERLIKEIEEDTFQSNTTESLFEQDSLKKMQESINRIIDGRL